MIPISSAVFVFLMALMSFLSIMVHKYRRSVSRSGGSERYALLGDGDESTTDSENEIFMIDETRDLYSAPTRHNLSDTEGDEEIDELDRAIDKLKADGDLGRGNLMEEEETF